MTPIIILSISVGVILVVSIVLGIVNWVQLASTSSKLANLDTEIEKKTREFDAIKKERPGTTQIPTEQFAPNPPQASMPTTESVGPHGPGGPEIEIVRNVRGTYDEAMGKGAHAIQSENGASFSDSYPPQQPGAPTPAAPQPEPTGPQAQPSPAPPHPAAQPAQPQQPTPQPAAQQPVVNQQTQQPPASGPASFSAPSQQPGKVIDITLYSSTLQDADFAGAWRVLANGLPASSDQIVRINLAGITFLDQKEIQYLHKFYETILNHGCSLQLVGCQPELRTTVQRDAVLAPLLA